MLKLIKNDMFNISNRLKRIDRNYCVLFNSKTKKFEVYYQNGFNFDLELVLPFDVLDFRTIRKVWETRVSKMEEIIKKMEEENKKLEKKNSENLKDELISKVKIILKKGV